MPQSSAHQEQLDAVAQAVDRASTADAATLAQLKTEILGRKAGALTRILRSLAGLPSEQRRAVGARANQLKQQLEEAIAARERALADEARAPKQLDWTMSGRAVWHGAVHPVTAVVDEICDVFRTLGFTRVTGPEAETEDYNFTKLNIGLDHPAADEHDTFYLAPGTLLRTHTSPMQARVMEPGSVAQAPQTDRAVGKAGDHRAHGAGDEADHRAGGHILKGESCPRSAGCGRHELQVAVGKSHDNPRSRSTHGRGTKVCCIAGP